MTVRTLEQWVLFRRSCFFQNITKARQCLPDSETNKHSHELFMKKQTKQTGEKYTRSALAAALNCSISTVRKYERLFSDKLKTPAGKRGQGTAREYLPEDITTLVAIHNLRNNGHSYDAIKHGLLDKALESGTVEFREEKPKQPAGDTEDEQKALALREELNMTQGALTVYKQENDRLLDELEKLREQLREADKAIGATEEVRKQNETLRERVDALEDKLDKANASVWQRLFRGRGSE